MLFKPSIASFTHLFLLSAARMVDVVVSILRPCRMIPKHSRAKKWKEPGSWTKRSHLAGPEQFASELLHGRKIANLFKPLSYWGSITSVRSRAILITADGFFFLIWPLSVFSCKFFNSTSSKRTQLSFLGHSKKQ